MTVPETFAQWTVQREGEAGQAWITALPGVLEELRDRWSLTFDDGPPRHGGLGLVLLGRRGDEPCALKVSWIDSTTDREAMALRAWDGRGAAQLLEAAPERGALLLERLDPSRTLMDLPLAGAIETAGRLLRRLSIPAPEGVERMRDTAAALAEGFPGRWDAARQPVPSAVLDRAIGLARELGPPAARCLVHGDFFFGQVLAGEREPWLAVDPKPLSGDPEYALAPLLWRGLDAMEADGGLERHFEALVDAAELDRERTRGWALVRTVDYWLWGLSVGLTYDPARCARIVAQL